MPDVSLEMLQSLIQRSLDEQAVLRRDAAETRNLLLAVVDQGRRTERRVAELRDELTVKAELMGRLGPVATQIDSDIVGQSPERLEARVERNGVPLLPVSNARARVTLDIVNALRDGAPRRSCSM